MNFEYLKKFHNYRHPEIFKIQKNKKNNIVCGDLIIEERSENYSAVILLDGIGSGYKANFSAHLAGSRILESIKSGISARQAAANVAASMREARTQDIPFAAFTLFYVLSSGVFTVLSYEMPPPIIIEKKTTYIPDARNFVMNKEIFTEYCGKLNKDISIIFVSDGITQAGMGKTFPEGLEIERVMKCINEKINSDIALEKIPFFLAEYAKEISCGVYEDDASVVCIKSSEGKILNIFTGPPSNKNFDSEVVNAFMKQPGFKVVCGSTTADIIAKNTGKKIINGNFGGNFYQPPVYKITGIDFVTEGAVVLNQLNNILDADAEVYVEDSCVSDIALLIKHSDLIIIWHGLAKNSAHENIVFRQMGILPRKIIIRQIIEKLKKMGKLAITHDI